MNEGATPGGAIKRQGLLLKAYPVFASFALLCEKEVDLSLIRPKLEGRDHPERRGAGEEAPSFGPPCVKSFGLDPEPGLEEAENEPESLFQRHQKDVSVG